MAKLPMATARSDQTPAVTLKNCDYVSDFQPYPITLS